MKKNFPCFAASVRVNVKVLLDNLSDEANVLKADVAALAIDRLFSDFSGKPSELGAAILDFKQRSGVYKGRDSESFRSILENFNR